jgi:hypothetical protein
VLCAAEPVFTRRPEAQKVGLNGVAEFHCGASGNPAPTIFWTKEVGILTLSCSLEAEYDSEYLQLFMLYLKILLRWHMLDFCLSIIVYLENLIFFYIKATGKKYLRYNAVKK